MSKVRVSAFAVSLDGYAAGTHQSLENPLGIRGPELFEWFFSTRTWKQMQGLEGGSTGVDDEWARRSMENVGAWILGRNMFGPVRGPWPDELWKGWWGEEPPYHVPTFVLTHYSRKALEMKGGTTFHFVTDGIHSALQRAKDAAKEKDVRIGGGVATIQQYLRAKLIDELHLAFRPILMGSGENLFAGMDLAALGYACTKHVSTEHAMHVFLQKTDLIPRFRCGPPHLRLTSAALPNYAFASAKGRIQSAERAVPTFSKTNKQRTSFSLIHADFGQCSERSFVWIQENSPHIPTLSSTVNKPKNF